MACSLLRYFMYEQSQILTPSIKTSLNDLMTVEELVTFAKNHRASNHPIYKKFINLNNKDNLELLRYYSIQYKKFSSDFCNYITNVLSLAPYGLNIDCIIENLNEENGDLSQKGFKSYPHKKLYNLFLEELTDHTKNSIKTTYISEVHDWHKEILEISKTSFASGVGALGIGNELVVPQIYQNILKGLNTSKKFSKRAIFFFELHSECDVKHSEDFINISIKISNKYENLRDLNNGVKKMLFLRERFCDKILMNFNEKNRNYI